MTMRQVQNLPGLKHDHLGPVVFRQDRFVEGGSRIESVGTSPQFNGYGRGLKLHEWGVRPPVHVASSEMRGAD